MAGHPRLHWRLQVRKTEDRLIDAMMQGKSYKGPNTAFDPTTGEVRLFGKLIAIYAGRNKGDALKYPQHLEKFAHGDLVWTMAGWPTVTTRSRINALALAFMGTPSVSQSKGKQYAHFRNGHKREIDEHEWIGAGSYHASI